MTDRNPGLDRIGRAALLATGLLFLLRCSMPSAANGADDHAKVAWRSDLGSAQAEAKSSDRLLWIQFTGPWCGNCRRMERGAFAQEPVIVESRERFVPVKLRADEHEDLTATLGLSVLPSTVIVRPNGEVVDKFEGFGEPAEFEAFLRITLNAEGRSPEQVAAREQTKKRAQLATRTQSTRDAGVALAGYDPVRMVEGGQLVPGRADLVAEHAGQTFQFANEADRAIFLQKPTTFAPINEGRCPVSQVDRGDFAAGDPRWGVVYNGHLFLFRNLGDRDRFAHDPERYAGVDQSARTTCPHCRERTSLTRRFSSRFSSMFALRSALPGASGSSPLPGFDQADPTASRTVADRLASFLSVDSIIRR